MVGTGGQLTGVLIGPEVVNITQVKQALQSNLAEVGNLLPLFVPADLPSTVLTADLAFLATDHGRRARPVDDDGLGLRIPRHEVDRHADRERSHHT